VPPRKFRAILFDVGRVLIQVDIARAAAGLAAGLTLSPAELWSAIQNDPHWQDWQEGRMDPHAWYEHLSKRLGISIGFEQFNVVWNQALHPEPLLDTGYLAGLAKRYRLALVSNTDPVHVAHIEASYHFIVHFPVRIYSCSIGASKPNPLIYREALRGCRVRAEEAVFIDDLAAYVESARRLGMAGIRFESPGQLASELGELGIQNE
jgi:glucose-1-phosphatase